MPEQTPQIRSLTEEILTVVLHNLESQAGFDANLLQRLRTLSEQGGMTRVAKVIEILKATGEAGSETP